MKSVWGDPTLQTPTTTNATPAAASTTGKWGRTSAWGDPNLQRTTITPARQTPDQTPDRPDGTPARQTPDQTLDRTDGPRLPDISTTPPPHQTLATPGPATGASTTPPTHLTPTPRTLDPPTPGKSTDPVPLPTLPFPDTSAFPVLPHSKLTDALTALLGHPPTPTHPSEFQFACSIAAAHHNRDVLRKYNNDLDAAIHAQPFSTLNLGSEFRPAHLLAPFLSLHPLWPKFSERVALPRRSLPPPTTIRRRPHCQRHRHPRLWKS